MGGKSSSEEATKVMNAFKTIDSSQSYLTFFMTGCDNIMSKVSGTVLLNNLQQSCWADRFYAYRFLQSNQRFIDSKTVAKAKEIISNFQIAESQKSIQMLYDQLKSILPTYNVSTFLITGSIQIQYYQHNIIQLLTKREHSKILTGYDVKQNSQQLEPKYDQKLKEVCVVLN